MQITCYLQLVPHKNRAGIIIGVTAKTLTQKCPHTPIVGAHLIKLNLDVPKEAFNATQVNVTIPIEKLAPQVTAEVK